MKYQRLTSLLTLCLLASNTLLAQMVGDCVFLKGRYVEVGIAPNGGYGSTLPAPTGYHPNLGGASFTFYDPGSATSTTSSNLLGFVADFGRDGWTTGTPGYFGDFYLPGTPQEGWAVRVGGVESEAYIPNYQFFGGPPPTGFSGTGTLGGTNLSYSNSGGISRGVWQGNEGALLIRQTTTLDTSKLYFTVNVVLTNTGAAALNNIYYIRTVDPDNEQTQTGDFTTNNTITYQLPNPGNKVLVSAVGTGAFPTNAYLGLGTKDCRAKCMIFDGGLAPGYSLDAIYAQTTPYFYNQGDNYVNDVGIGLVYNIGTIAAGDSTSLTYAYILNAAYIDSALDATQPPFLVNTLSFNSGDTINMCTYNFDTVLVSLGNAAFYNWQWSPGTYLTDSTGWSNVIPADSLNTTITYTITGVNISGGCDTVRYELTFTHAPVTITLGNHDTTICYGESVGALVSGPPLLDYTWTPATGVSDPNIMNPILTPSVTTTYSVTASSSEGCTAEIRSFTINVRQRPVITFDSSYVQTCVGVSVPLHAFVSPTGVGYSYVWSPATNLSSNTVSGPTVTPTSVGNTIYTLTVSPSDLARCTGTNSLTVHTEGDFSITTPDATACLGTPVNVVVAGSDSLRYSWTPSANVVTSTSRSPVITPAAQGYYTYTVTGSYAHCPDYHHVFHIRVDTPAHPVNIVDTICLGMTDSFDLTVPGANGTDNYYHYQWTPAADVSNDTIPNPIITPPNVGTHTYVVTIRPLASGCSVNSIITIEVLPNAISVRPTDTAICFGQVVQVIGNGNPAFQYQWLPTVGIANANILNTLITPDTTTFYTVVASFHRCPDMPATLNLVVEPNPSVYLGGNRPICQFDTAHLHASVSPAWYSGYIYSWSPAADLDNTTSANVVFDGSVDTKVVVTVSTPAGCVGKDSVTITVLAGNFATIDPDASFCPGDSRVVTVAAPAASGYHWMPSVYVIDSAAAAPVVSPEATQTFTVVVTTTAGCTDTLNWTATVYPAALISIPVDSVLLYAGESYHIEPYTNCSSFTWFPPAGLDNPYISNPVANPDVSTLYIATGTTENGCVARDSIYIYRTDDAILAMPNAFAPGNGSNGEFKLITKGISQVNYFRVYNRWGNLVFETKNMNEGWDGSWKGAAQPFGVYIYDVQAVSLTGKIINKSGNVTLLR
jgi:gliding motility-associated-like protein